MGRQADIERNTKETKIKLSLDLDGSGKSSVDTGIPFLDHMMELFARHGLFDMTLKANGDLEIDAHHTVEDIGICLGSAFSEALEDKRGIRRYGDVLMPMDETLVAVAVDISGRPYLSYDIDLPIELIGTFDTSLTRELLQAFVNNAVLTLHVRMFKGGNAHHIIEAVFKGLARALDAATVIDVRVDDIPSTKGRL